MKRCECGHLRGEHIKAYEEDLEMEERYGEPQKCLVIGCDCKKYKYSHTVQEAKK